MLITNFGTYILDAWNSILSKKFYFDNILSRTLRPKEVSGSKLENLGRKLIKLDFDFKTPFFFFR